VPEAVITLRVLKRGARAQQILDTVAEQLGLGAVEPDDHRVVRLGMGSARPPRAWERVRDALDAAGDDWREWLHLEPRPNR
jgi:hypothetical protein